MSELPEELLSTRRDEEWEQAISDQRIRYALRWAARQLSEIFVAQSLGASLDDLDDRIEEVWSGIERRLTRRELVSAFVSWASGPAEQIQDRILGRAKRDLDFLDKVNWEHDWSKSSLQ